MAIQWIAPLAGIIWLQSNPTASTPGMIVSYRAKTESSFANSVENPYIGTKTLLLTIRELI